MDLNPSRPQNLLKISKNSYPFPWKNSHRHKSLQAISGSSQTPRHTGMWDSILRAPYLAIPPKVPAFFMWLLCLAGIWDFQPCYRHTHAHTHTHTRPYPSKWKGLNICYEADSILFRVNRSGLNPPQISLTFVVW